MRKTLKNPMGALLAAALVASLPTVASAAGFEVYVTNERSGDVTVIDGATFKVVQTIPVGKRPRGIHASPDGKTVYVGDSGLEWVGPKASRGPGDFYNYPIRIYFTTVTLGSRTAVSKN